MTCLWHVPHLHLCVVRLDITLINEVSLLPSRGQTCCMIATATWAWFSFLPNDKTYKGGILMGRILKLLNFKLSYLLSKYCPLEFCKYILYFKMCHSCCHTFREITSILKAIACLYPEHNLNHFVLWIIDEIELPGSKGYMSDMTCCLSAIL
jgi:hypothetical protein